MIMIMNTTNKPLANIVMFNLTTLKEMRFGFLFKSDLEVFKRIVIQDIKFRITEDDRNLKEHIDCPIYNLYVNNDTDTNNIIHDRLDDFFSKYDVKVILRWKL